MHISKNTSGLISERLRNFEGYIKADVIMFLYIQEKRVRNF